MEGPAQERYQDSPSSSRSSSPSPSTPSTPSTQASTTKPLPSLPGEATPEPLEPYRDDPSDSEDTPAIVAPTPQRYRSASPIRSTRAQPPAYFTPYTDLPPENDDDVPLAHLYPYPTEAPPSYQAVVRESFRATLIQHIPDNSGIETDEEAGVERAQADDVRFSVERVVATIIVAMMLLVIAALLGLLVFFSPFKPNW